jgi:polynucleotide 5'-hydroxyl-kinase GRC3/NOL9
VDGAGRLRAEWWPALEAAARVSVTLVIGASETGKTTLVTGLANALLARRLSVAIVDADLGQSEIGPPTTIGLGRVRAPLARPADAEVVALEFIGATTPPGHARALGEGMRRLVDRARAAGIERVLVDTSGLVAGGLGRHLKNTKIARVAPDVVVAVQRADEAEHILRDHAGVPPPLVVRVPALPAPRRRTPRARREHRERALRAHLAAASRVALDAAAVGIAPAGEDLVGRLVGVRDATGSVVGLGRVVAVDEARGTVAIETAVPRSVIAAVTVGRERFDR